MVQVMEVLDQLEDEFENLKQVPLTGGKVLIEKEVITEYINEIRSALPEDIVKAHWVQQERSKMLEETKAECEKAIADAREKYDQILQDAAARAEELVSQSAIVIQSEEKAERIMEEANLKALKLKEGSKEYVSSVFDELLSRMNELGEIIRKDKEDIDNM